MNEAYLCLGGNLGNCIETFTRAIALLEKQSVSLVKYSSIYLSEAWGMEGAPEFHNQVILVKSPLSGEKLIRVLLETEQILGRERESGNGYQSRPIDLDILFFNAEIIDSKELKVPHPRLHLRRFVLEPLNEIAPGLAHPVLGNSISQLLAICEDKNSVKKLESAV